ncbi:MAG: 4-hydroxy-tetrahydrodipicolinate synthase [Chthoniobacterales bacterium]
MFEGTHTALVTPFRDDQIDEAAFRDLIEEQIAAGITGIVPVGTTGESPTLPHTEHNTAIRLSVEAAAGRCQVIAGTGSNSTAEAIELTREAERLGATAALLVTPYYNKPSPEGLFLHYRAVANAVGIPLILYSIPGRCGIEISVETAVRLAEACPNVRAIKEAGGSVERVSALRHALPEEFEILSGDDSLTLPFMSVGAVGVISVASNIVPAEVVRLVSAWLDDDPTAARAQHLKFYRLFKELFVETNPVPIKTALALQGRMTADVRLPLCPLTDQSLDRLRSVLTDYGLLNS